MISIRDLAQHEQFDNLIRVLEEDLDAETKKILDAGATAPTDEIRFIAGGIAKLRVLISRLKAEKGSA